MHVVLTLTPKKKEFRGGEKESQMKANRMGSQNKPKTSAHSGANSWPSAQSADLALRLRNKKDQREPLRT